MYLGVVELNNCCLVLIYHAGHCSCDYLASGISSRESCLDQLLKKVFRRCIYTGTDVCSHGYVSSLYCFELASVVRVFK